MGINAMKNFDFLHRHSTIIITAALLLIVAMVASQGFEAVQTASELEGPLVMEPGNQYSVSEIMERQEDAGICMFPFVIVENYGYPSGHPSKYPDGNANNEPPTAFVREIRFQTEGAGSETTFTAVAIRPTIVEITLYNSKGKTCGRAVSQSSPPFQRETAKTFFGIDSDQVVLLSAKVPLNKEAEKISISYVEDRTTKSHLPLFILPHFNQNTKHHRT